LSCSASRRLWWQRPCPSSHSRIRFSVSKVRDRSGASSMLGWPTTRQRAGQRLVVPGGTSQLREMGLRSKVWGAGVGEMRLPAFAFGAGIAVALAARRTATAPAPLPAPSRRPRGPAVAITQPPTEVPLTAQARHRSDADAFTADAVRQARQPGQRVAAHHRGVPRQSHPAPIGRRGRCRLALLALPGGLAS
jgi:hypothetical protein